MDKIDASGKKVLVTGGNGYLGRKLIESLLAKKAVVYSFGLQEKSLIDGVSYCRLDLRDKEKLRKEVEKIQPEIIYHLAASLDRERSFENKEEVFEVNLNATINLLNAMKDIKYRKFIFTSTSEVYGGGKISPPYKEFSDFVPASPYSLSKYAAEMTIRSFSDSYQKSYVILRIFNFFGAGMPKGFFIPQLKDKLEKGEDFDMTKGEQIRDFVHIDDVVRALLLSSKESLGNDVLNVCTGTGRSIKDIALYLKENLQSTSNINFGALPYRENENWEMIGDNTKLRELLGFSPDFNLEDLLKK